MKKKNNTPYFLRFVQWFFPKLERFLPNLAHRFFVHLFFTPLRYPVPEKERKAETFAEHFSIQVGDKRVQCYQWGAGIPVVVVHGWAGRAGQFRRFIKPLNAAGFCVVGFDAPAHGRSSGKQTDILEFEEALQKIFDRVGQPAAVIGHSFGGAAALYSAMKGLSISKLINIGTPTIGDEIIGTYLRAMNASPASGIYFKQYVTTTYGKTFEEITAEYTVQHLPQPIDLLMIHDEQDKEVNIKHAEFLQKLYPTAKLIRTNGLGHTRILKDDAVIHSCVTFISG